VKVLRASDAKAAPLPQGSEGEAATYPPGRVKFLLILIVGDLEGLPSGGVDRVDLVVSFVLYVPAFPGRIGFHDFMMPDGSFPLQGTVRGQQEARKEGRGQDPRPCVCALTDAFSR
jgi:hypothetical protein